MRDQVSIVRINELHPAIRQQVKICIEKAEVGFPEYMAVRVVQGLRTFEYQNELYAQGRTKPGLVVTNAIGGMSYHNYGLAIDFAILLDKDKNGKYDTLSWDIESDLDKDRIKDWMEVVAIFKTAGFEWGGDWIHTKDRPHFQKTFGFKEKELLAKYQRKEFLADSTFIKL